MNKQCKKCGIRNDLHKMIHGESLKNNLCKPCKKASK